MNMRTRAEQWADWALKDRDQLISRELAVHQVADAILAVLLASGTANVPKPPS